MADEKKKLQEQVKRMQKVIEAGRKEAKSEPVKVKE